MNENTIDKILLEIDCVNGTRLNDIRLPILIVLS